MTDLQLKVLRILWSRGEATVAQVQEDLRPEHDLATTTVSTLLSRMVKRGDVAMRREGRQFHYIATVAEADLTTRAFNEVADLLFSGNATAAIAHLLDTTELDAAELHELKERLAAKEAAARRAGGRG
jgi:BlaI family transcriptional regulator, penicillinase repressor